MAQIQIGIDGDKDMEDIASQLCGIAAGVFDETHPDQWARAMETLAQKIRQHVRNTSPDPSSLQIIPGQPF